MTATMTSSARENIEKTLKQIVNHTWDADTSWRIKVRSHAFYVMFRAPVIRLLNDKRIFCLLVFTSFCIDNYTHCSYFIKI